MGLLEQARGQPAFENARVTHKHHHYSDSYGGGFDNKLTSPMIGKWRAVSWSPGVKRGGDPDPYKDEHVVEITADKMWFPHSARSWHVFGSKVAHLDWHLMENRQDGVATTHRNKEHEESIEMTMHQFKSSWIQMQQLALAFGYTSGPAIICYERVSEY